METSKEKAHGKIPTNWELVKFGDILRKSPEYGANVSAKKFDSNTFRYIRITDILENGNLTNINFAGISKEEGESYKLIQDDILIARTGNTVGKSYLYNIKDGNCSFAGYLIRFKIDTSKSTSKYIIQYLHSELFWNWVKSIVRTGAQPNINSKEYQSLQLLLPPLSEQQKIAEILSTVDDKIEIIDQQIIETQELKKGLMQRLLTKGIGHTKFKDSSLGMIPKSWEVVNFNNVCSISSKKFKQEDGKCVDLEHIEQGTGRLIGYSPIEDKSSIKNEFNIGDVLFCKLRPYLRKYWQCEFYGGCTSELMVLQPLSNFDSKYLFYTIQRDDFIENSVSKSFGTKMPRTSWNILSEFVMGLPPLKEQQKIADILNSVDDKLEILLEKKTHYQELKQGLMQQLLTGKIRVKV